MSSVSISTSYVSLSKDKQYMIQKVYVTRMICMYEPIISSLLDRKISPPLATSKRDKIGLQLMIKVEEVEVETRNAGRPSSPHVDAPCDPQYDQSSVRGT